MPHHLGVERNDQIGHFEDMPTLRQLGFQDAAAFRVPDPQQCLEVASAQWFAPLSCVGFTNRGGCQHGKKLISVPLRP
jgi:hypothetical protein